MIFIGMTKKLAQRVERCKKMYGEEVESWESKIWLQTKNYVAIALNWSLYSKVLREFHTEKRWCL